MMNPWHMIDYGKKAPQEVKTIIEVPAGSKIKYELDKETGLIKVDRILSSAVHYPANYGFIPQTYCDDKDPLDILVICQQPIHPGSLIEARAIGVIEMIDKGEQDDKILAVATKDPYYKDIFQLDQLPKSLLLEIEQFFKDYKILENKKVEIKKIHAATTAHEIIKQAIDLYIKTFKK